MLSHVDAFNEEIEGFSNWLNEIDQKPLLENLSEFSWAHFYEKSFIENLNDFFVNAQLIQQKEKIIAADNQIQATLSFQDNLADNLDKIKNNLPEDQHLSFGASMMTYGIVMLKNARSLMIYGRYINDLIAIARTSNSLKERDEALLNAIRIDASVITCKTASVRISKAVCFSDTDFLKDLRNAIEGKLGELEAQNFQKMRFILQVLHESGGINLTDKELKELFVNQLNLYSDSQSTAEKNLGEFTRKFKKKKSTI